MSSKRRPIEYTAQFVPGVFRPADEIESELKSLNDEEINPPARSFTAVDTSHLRDNEERPGPQSKAMHVEVRTNERTNERSQQVQEEPRRRIRHSFDIWEDQLLSLAEIQAESFVTTRRKPKLGELVQEALDAYIHAQKRTSERTDERLNGRTTRRG